MENSRAMQDDKLHQCLLHSALPILQKLPRTPSKEIHLLKTLSNEKKIFLPQLKYF